MQKSDQPGISRRKAFQRAAAAASALPWVASAQNPAPQQGQGARGGRGGRGGRSPMISGGRGPAKVLLITKGHPFNWLPFFEFFDSMGQDITWTHVEQPAAQLFFHPDTAKGFDAFVLYDWAGKGNIQPPPELNTGFRDLLRQGKGFVFFHHALASWNGWPEYKEVIGGAADWGGPMKIRGKDYPKSGYRGKTHQHITVVDKSHPVVQGLGDGFDIVDETYLCPMFEDTVHAILRTDFVPKMENFEQINQRTPNWNHPPGSNMTGWVKSAENSPIVYIQHGHDEEAWGNPALKMLMTNAIKWVSSPEGLAWAKKNPSKIWKS